MPAWASRLLVPRVWVPVVMVVLGIGLLGLVGGLRSDAAPPPGETLQQWLFQTQVRAAQERVADGNPVTLVSARRHRDRALCRLLPGRRAVGWLGRLDDVSTTLAQDGTIKIALDDDVEIHTAPSAPLRPDTAVFESVADLHDGDLVRFTGRFVGGGERTCLRTTNRFHHSGVASPDFEFRFGSLSKAD